MLTCSSPFPPGFVFGVAAASARIEGAAFRRDYLRSHLRELHRAIADGLPPDGYFRWSFIDNCEWEDGYQRRFGIVHCDFATQVRTPKLSARYDADVIRTRTIV